MSRQKLVEATELSRPTVHAVLKELLAEGWVREAKPRKREGNGDKRLVAAEFELYRRAGFVAGADIGHHHIHVAIADANGKPLAKEARPGSDEDGTAAARETLDVDEAGPAALRDVVEMLDRCLQTERVKIDQVRAIGVGVPAPVTHDGHIASSVFLSGWTTVDVADEISKLLAERYPRTDTSRVRIVVENDANLGAHAERRRRGPDRKDLAYIKLSTGVGMGLLLDGRVYRGATGVAAEFGHVSIPAIALERTGLTADDLPPPCPRCDKPGCVENLVGCERIVERLRRADGYPDDLTIDQVIDHVQESKTDHPSCLQALVDAGIWVGYALAEQITMLDLEVVVVGGLLSRAGEVLLTPIRDAVARHSVRLAPTAIEPLDPSRIKTIEVEGAIALALSHSALPAIT